MAHDWRPTIANSCLRECAAVVGRVRTFFADRGVCEVRTPVLSRFATTEPTLDSLALTAPAQTVPWYLRTSPESAMKRLLAHGSGDIYQLGPVFRAEESGRLHLTEFTLLEWYRIGFDHLALMTEVADLLRAVGCTRPLTRLSYGVLFARHFGVDPYDLATTELAACARALPLALEARDFDDRALLFDCLYACVLEPALATMGAVLLHDFPPELRAYARLSSATPAVAERFELIVDGIEIANGYHEIVDAEEQARCFAHENTLRVQRGRRPLAPDSAWLAALAAGLPACAGVALGVERLLMVLFGLSTIAAAAAFAHELE